MRALHASSRDKLMAERGELDLTGAKQNTGVWRVKVSETRAPRGASESSGSVVLGPPLF